MTNRRLENGFPLLCFQLLCYDCSYLNNGVFLLRNYRLIVAPRKFVVLKRNICPRSEALRATIHQISKGQLSDR